MRVLGDADGEGVAVAQQAAVAALLDGAVAFPTAFAAGLGAQVDDGRSLHASIELDERDAQQVGDVDGVEALEVVASGEGEASVEGVVDALGLGLLQGPLGGFEQGDDLGPTRVGGDAEAGLAAGRGDRLEVDAG